MKYTKHGITFLFSFSTALLVLTTLLHFTLFNVNFVVRTLEQSNYYRSAITNLNERLVQNAQPSGFPTSLFEEYISYDEGLFIMEATSRSVLHRVEYNLPVQEFEARMIETTTQYLQEQDVEITLHLQQSIQSFIDKNTKEYQAYLQVPYLDLFGQLINIYSLLFPFLLGISLLLFITTGIFLFKMSTRLKRFYHNIYISMITTGLTLSIIPLFLLLTNTIGKINLSPVYYSTFITQLGNTTLTILSVVGVVFIVLGCLFGFRNTQTMGVRKRKRQEDYIEY